MIYENNYGDQYHRSDLEADFQDYLAESYEVIVIEGVAYEVAHFYEEIDPVAYDEAFTNWLDAEGWEEV